MTSFADRMRLRRGEQPNKRTPTTGSPLWRVYEECSGAVEVHRALSERRMLSASSSDREEINRMIEMTRYLASEAYRRRLPLPAFTYRYGDSGSEVEVWFSNEKGKCLQGFNMFNAELVQKGLDGFLDEAMRKL